MKNLLEKLKNPGVLVGVVSLVGLLLVQFGVKVDLVWLDETIKIACALGIAIGVINNPDTPGVDNPFKKIK